MKPEPDVFSGCGNGTLHIAIVQDPDKWNAAAGDRYIDVCINSRDWEAIFVDTLHCSTGDAWVPGDDIIELTERNRRTFQRSIAEYPMLGRIFDMYEDYVFSPNEIEKLREECAKLRATTLPSDTQLGLRKLVYACDEASRGGFNLFLSGD